MNKVIQVDPAAINNIITNAKARQIIYAVFVILGVVIGALQTAGITAGWLEISVNVYTYLTALVVVLALTNTPGEKKQEEVIVDEVSEEVVKEQPVTFNFVQKEDESTSDLVKRVNDYINSDDFKI